MLKKTQHFLVFGKRINVDKSKSQSLSAQTCCAAGQWTPEESKRIEAFCSICFPAPQSVGGREWGNDLFEAACKNVAFCRTITFGSPDNFNFFKCFFSERCRLLTNNISILWYILFWPMSSVDKPEFGFETHFVLKIEFCSGNIILVWDSVVLSLQHGNFWPGLGKGLWFKGIREANSLASEELPLLCLFWPSCKTEMREWDNMLLMTPISQ